MRTFATEDNRKTKLFEAWIDYLNNIHSQFKESDFEEVFEDLVEVIKISDEFLDVKLEDGQILRDIPITHEISEHSLKKDKMYIVLGQNGDQLIPLHLVSIGSIIGQRKSGLYEVHFTVNPLLVDVCNTQNTARSMYHS